MTQDFHVRLRPGGAPKAWSFPARMRPKRGKKAKRSPSPPPGLAGDRRTTRPDRGGEVLRQKERLMESERKRAGPGSIPLSLSPPSRPLSCAHRNQRYSALSLGSRRVACVVSVRCVSLIVSTLPCMSCYGLACTILVQKDRQGRRPVARHCSGCLSEFVLAHTE